MLNLFPFLRWINQFLPLAWHTVTGNMGDGTRVGTRELDKGRLGFIEMLFNLTLSLKCSLKHSHRILKAVSNSLQEKSLIIIAQSLALGYLS